MKAKIYLDFNSTHPPVKAVLDTARDFYLEHFANSSGLSLESQAVNKRIEEAREDVARLLGVTAKQVIFTSCATESNNLLIREFHRRAHANQKFRVLSSPFEHPSVAECLKHLRDTEVTFLRSDRHGQIDPTAFGDTDWSAFDIITMMAVQNESGVALPLFDLCRALPENHPPVLADFSQALPKLAHDAPDYLRPEAVAHLTQKNIFLTATGHKIGAGFGAGLIVTPVLPKDWKDTALFAGGNQEHGLRAGSHNVEAIIAFAEAFKLKLGAASYEKWQKVTQDLEAVLADKIPATAQMEIIGAAATRAPGTTLLLLPGVPIDFLIMALDKEGITVSTGTSCKSRSRSPSAALLAMGHTEAEALSVVRLSYGQDLTAAEMERVAVAVAEAVVRLA